MSSSFSALLIPDLHRIAHYMPNKTLKQFRQVNKEAASACNILTFGKQGLLFSVAPSPEFDIVEVIDKTAVGWVNCCQGLDFDMKKALHNASRDGQLRVVEFLVSRLNDDDLRADNNSALRIAAHYGNVGVVKFLASRLNDAADLRDSLLIAASHDHLKTTKFLASRLNDDDIRDALAIATEYRYLKLMKALSSRLTA